MRIAARSVTCVSSPAMASGIKHIIWDWNGTLLDDVEACVSAINPMLIRRGLAVLTPEIYRDVFDFPVKSYYAKLGFDMAQEDWDAMAQEFHSNYAREEQHAALQEGARETLIRLADEGMQMSVLSACEISRLEKGLRARGIRKAFKRVRGLSDLYAHSKLELGHQLMGDLASAPERMLLVGDTTHDYEVANALGCPCVLVARGHQSKTRLSACACPVLDGLEALTTALSASILE